MHILLIEDDQDTAHNLVNSLTLSHHQVTHCDNGQSGLDAAITGHFDAMVIDRMLPQLDGLTVVQRLRENHNTTPIILLTALGEVDDRVKGLSAGADDYLAKPFALAELLARLSAITRRQQPTAPTRLQVADLVLDQVERQVTRANVPITLRQREFDLLAYLMQHADQLVTRTMLLENVWHYHFDPQTNVIDVHISRLRNKITLENTAPLLHTIRGKGYCLHA